MLCQRLDLSSEALVAIDSSKCFAKHVSLICVAWIAPRRRAIAGLGGWAPSFNARAMPKLELITPRPIRRMDWLLTDGASASGHVVLQIQNPRRDLADSSAMHRHPWLVRRSFSCHPAVVDSRFSLNHSFDEFAFQLSTISRAAAIVPRCCHCIRASSPKSQPRLSADSEIQERTQPASLLRRKISIPINEVSHCTDTARLARTLP